MAVLLLCDHDNSELKDSTAKALTAAKAIGSPVHALVAGAGCGPVAEQAALLEGVDKVLVADHADYQHQLAENMAALILSLMDDHDGLVASTSTTGKNVLPRVAAALDVMQISDILSVEVPNQFTRPIYAGNAIQTVETSDPKLVATVRTSVFAAAEAAASAAAIEQLDAPAGQGLSQFVSEELTQSERPELTSARIIISGGRGLGSNENFTTYIEPVADLLGAAIGASRAAVDAGYMSNDYQVGQTGKVVAPELYIAVGISGAIQHLAGMKDSKIIVAINKDEEAPIFQIADYGLVADLFTALPQLKTELETVG